MNHQIIQTLTASGLVATGQHYLGTVNVTTAGTTSTAVIYDNTTGSGKVLATIDTTTKDYYNFADSLATKGIYVVITGSGASVTVTAK